ncbi:MgtC/SapB family protein [Acinetobacter sp.]|uniref:MgtC/SapB family protein n=1 Tax=Acinetobacter sp. TaxID=472 RepID=UPI0031DDAA79
MQSQAIQNIRLDSLLDSSISLLTAFILGGLIGFERQYRQRTAGLRTNVLVAIGAASFVDMACRLDGNEGGIRVIAYVVSGIGFLGAGVIMREEGHVRGLNTAATLWCSAAVGAAAGADLILEAMVATLFILSANTLLRPIVNTINRQPLDLESTEMTNVIYVIIDRLKEKVVVQQIIETLESHDFPVSHLEAHSFGQNELEVELTLAAHSVDGEELDQIIEKLSAQPDVRQIFWSPSSRD